MSRCEASRRGELDVGVHHLGMLALEPVAQTGEELFRRSGGEVVPHRDSRQDQDLLRAHLDRAQVDDFVDSRLRRDRSAKRIDDLVGRRLSDDQPARAPGELIGDVNEDRADDRACERVEAVIAGPCGEPQARERRHQASQRGAVFVQDGPQGRVAQLLQEAAHRDALLARRVPHLTHGDAQRKGLEKHGQAEHDETNPRRRKLLWMGEPLVCLIHREDPAAEEQEERHDQCPEVALFSVTERVLVRRGLHAPPNADVEEDLVQRVGDRVRGLGHERTRAGDVRGDRLGDRDGQVAGEGREDRASRALRQLPAVFAFRTGFGTERRELPRDRGLADRERAPIPERRRDRSAEPHELILAVRLRVLKVDPRLEAELDNALPNERARRLGNAMKQRVLGLSHFARRARGPYPSCAIHSRVSPVTTGWRVERSRVRVTPERNAAVRSSSANWRTHSSTAAGPSRAACSNGRPTPTTVAPRARAFAASRPLRTPPVAMTGKPERALPATATALGTPQSRKTWPSLARAASPRSCARIASIAANEVPPTPPTSISFTPRARSRRAASPLMPAPVSFAMTGTELRRTSLRIAVSRPKARVCPSGCTDSSR